MISAFSHRLHLWYAFRLMLTRGSNYISINGISHCSSKLFVYLICLDVRKTQMHLEKYIANKRKMACGGIPWRSTRTSARRSLLSNMTRFHVRLAISFTPIRNVQPFVRRFSRNLQMAIGSLCSCLLPSSVRIGQYMYKVGIINIYLRS
jgi:hypothetical protein